MFKAILICASCSLSLLCGLYSLSVMGNQHNEAAPSLLSECHCYSTMSQERNNINFKIMAVRTHQHEFPLLPSISWKALTEFPHCDQDLVII